MEYVTTLDSTINAFNRIQNSDIHILTKLNKFLSGAQREIDENPNKGIFFGFLFILLCIF